MAVTDLVNGVVYFMGERDVLSGATSDYYKIGIVKGDRTVGARTSEHNTGNPRSVFAVSEISSPAAQTLETRLHNEFAIHRVSSNEWFHLPNNLFENVFKTATLLNDELIRHAEVLAVAKNLDAPGEGDEIAPSAEIEELVSRASQIAALRKVLTAYVKQIDANLKQYARGTAEWDAMVRVVQKAERSSFSSDLVKSLDKELWEQFMVEGVAKYRKSFAFPTLSISLDETLNEYGLPAVEDCGDDVHALHRAHLDHWSIKARLDWEFDLIEAQLLYFARESRGIAGYLKWTKPEISRSFDKNRFELEHPDVYQQCIKVTPAKVEEHVVEWAGYSM